MGAADLRAFVPVETEPAQAVEDALDHLRRRALGVGVFDAQHEHAAEPPREQPVEEGRAGAADVQVAGGRWSEADADHLEHCKVRRCRCASRRSCSTPTTRELLRDGHSVPLSPKAFDLLSILVADRPKAISKSDLQERLWPATFVVEKNLANLVSEIRDALGDDPSNPRFIRTVHRFGYAFRETLPRAETGRPRVAAARSPSS